MNMGNGKLKNWIVNKIFTGWTSHRSELDFSAKTFSEMWEAQRIQKKNSSTNL
jgi:L-lactate dehydrogenase complex protein LldF